MTKIICFKNGQTIEVSQEVVDIIGRRIVEGCKDYQIFGNNEGIELIVNISDISYIQ